jgi:transcriptional regulator with XRE-family HTH domain
MRVAESKSVTTLTDLKEKTGVDRKTLRAINTGRPVKETTLQAIANKLRVPLAHLLGSTAVDKREDVSGGDAAWTMKADNIGPGYCDIKLQRLDVTALRRLASETDEITWFLNIDQMSEELEALLLRLRENLRGWFNHVLGIEFGPEEQDNLLDQISYLKRSADIDKCVEELAQRKLKISGAIYVVWDKERPRHPYEDYPLPILRYSSRLKAALSIASKEKDNSTARVFKGSEPPPKIVESELLSDIDYVEVDGTEVWSRETFSDKAEKSGSLDSGEIPF